MENIKTLLRPYRAVRNAVRRELKGKWNYQFRRQQTRDWFDKEYVIPTVLYFECVNVCNAKCIFCYYPKADEKKSLMSLNDFSRVVDQFANMGGESISLTPTVGDPLLDRYFQNRLQIIDEKQISKINFYTNLINYKDRIEQSIINLKNTSVQINVSVVGFDRDAYMKYMGVDKFEIIKSNLGRLSQITSKNISVEVVLRDYAGSGISLGKFKLFLQSIGLSYNIQEEFDSWSGLVSDEIGKLTELKKKPLYNRKGPCAISYSKPLVTWDLKLKICDCRDAKNELVVGDLKVESLRTLWNGKAARRIRDSMYDSSLMPDVCKKCEVYVSIYEAV